MFGSLQMDEVADPIILAYELGDTGSSDWTSVKELAGYLVANGPATPEERWEEIGGYSPATMAAEIAGLLCAASIASANGDTVDAVTYQSTAQSWASEVDSLTYTGSRNIGTAVSAENDLANSGSSRCPGSTVVIHAGGVSV